MAVEEGRFDLEIVSKFAYSTGEMVHSGNITHHGKIVMYVEYNIVDGLIYSPIQFANQRLYSLFDYLNNEYNQYYDNLMSYVNLNETKKAIYTQEEFYEDTCNI